MLCSTTSARQPIIRLQLPRTLINRQAKGNQIAAVFEAPIDHQSQQLVQRKPSPSHLAPLNKATTNVSDNQSAPLRLSPIDTTLRPRHVHFQIDFCFRATRKPKQNNWKISCLSSAHRTRSPNNITNVHKCKRK
jgi:hypothetical protein